jgi:3-oxoadipate enol-lactonase/4-carboxymuconolactone decarboxylase
MFLRTQVDGYAGAGEALAVSDLRAAVTRFAMPVLVLVGDRDPSAPVERSREIAAAIPGARLVVIPGGYHLPLGEHAAAVNAAIAEHLAMGAGDALARGAQTRSEVLGADHVGRTAALASDLDREFQMFLTRVAWGEVWSRPHFDRRTRSIITIAILAALGREGELELHLRAIANTGATRADVSELLLHVAVYAGIPAANAAMRIAKRVLEAP